MARDAKRHRCENGRKQCDRGYRIKRPRLRRRIAKRQRVGCRNKNVRDLVVVAAGATQPDAVPSVEDLAIRGRKEQDARQRGSVRPESWLVAVQNAAAANDPGGMLAAASQWPTARDAIAAVDDDGVPERAERPRGSD